MGQVLCNKYAKYGFIAVAAVQFMDEYAPHNWNYSKFGRPAVYFMLHRQIMSLNNADEFAESVPCFPYDEAYQYREELIGNAP